MHGINEGKPTLVLRDDVVPLRQADVWKVAGTWVQAFKDDPVLCYRRNSEEQTGWSLFIDRLIIASIFSLLFKSKVALRIHSGAAFIFAQCSWTRGIALVGPVDKTIVALLNGLYAILNRRIGSAKQRRRNKAVDDKTQETVNKVLGDRTKDMLEVIILGTEPRNQGIGYVGTLLDAVTSLADITGQASWLHCSNIRDVEFYTLHGFRIVGSIFFGNRNPAWREAPVVTKIMVREPQRRI